MGSSFRFDFTLRQKADLTLALSLEERDSEILIGRRSSFSRTFIPSPPRFLRLAVFKRDEGM